MGSPNTASSARRDDSGEMAVAPTAGANSASQARHAAQDGYGHFQTSARSGTISALPRWSQPVAATLYLRGKRWSVGWNGDFIEVLLRQGRRSYGIAGSVGSR